jgi:hypothetical protein
MCAGYIFLVSQLCNENLPQEERMNRAPKAKSRVLKKNKAENRPRCGLCGKTKKLTKAECCNQWICDDEDKYVLFSYAINSCYRNHRRYTLCGYHPTEEHPGDLKDCPKCRNSFATEMYVFYGTNEFNCPDQYLS